MKKCINGIMREMTSEELKEQNDVVATQEVKPNTSVEERLQKLEKFLEKLGLNK